MSAMQHMKKNGSASGRKRKTERTKSMNADAR